MSGNPAGRALWRGVLLGFISASATHFLMTSSRVVVALDLVRGGHSGFVVGLVVGLFGLIPALFSIVMGRFIDRRGTRASAVIGAVLALAGASTALSGPAAFGAVPALAAAALLVGAGGAMAFLTQQQVIARGVPAERRIEFLSVTGVLYSLTHFLGPLSAGLAIDHLGMRKAYVMLLVAGALACATSPLVRGEGAAAGSPRAPGGRVLDLLHEPELRAIYVLSGLVYGCWEAHAILLPIYGSSIGLSATAIGSILAVFSAALVIARAAIPAAVRRLGEWRVLGSSLALSGACFLLYPWFQSPFVLGSLAFFLGLAAGINQPLVSGMLMERAPENRSGEALGLRNAITSGEALAVPTLLGSLAGSFGAIAIYLATAGAALAGAGYGNRHGRRAAHSPRKTA